MSKSPRRRAPSLYSTDKLRNIIKANSLISDDGCWLWQRSLNRAGYGHAWNGIAVMLAHRMSFVAFRGEILTGMYICHKCDTPKCVNPDHLFMGTPSDNVIDSYNKNRRPISGPKRGQCPLAKLTPEQVAIVRYELSKRPYSKAEISRRLGIPYHTIWDIERGRNY